MRLAYQLPDREDNNYVQPDGSRTTRYAEVSDDEDDVTIQYGALSHFIFKCTDLDDSGFLELHFYAWVPMDRIEVKNTRKGSDTEEILVNGFQTVIKTPISLSAPDPDMTNVAEGSCAINDGTHRTAYMRRIGCTYAFAKFDSELRLDDDRMDSEEFWRRLYDFDDWGEFRNVIGNLAAIH